MDVKARRLRQQARAVADRIGVDVKHRTCTVPGCSRRHEARGYCPTHYRRWQRWGSPTAVGLDFRPTACSVNGCQKPLYGGRRYCAMHLNRVRRTGSVDLRGRSRPCSVDGCGSTALTRGMCDKHVTRWYRTGRVDLRSRLAPDDDIKYRGWHLRLERILGKAVDQVCVDCGGRADEWSYNHDGTDERFDENGWPFVTDVTCYSPRCRACHTRLDRWSDARGGR